MTQPGDAGRDDALDRGQLQDSAVKGAAWTMVHTLVSVPLAFLVNLLLARILEPVGYGRLTFLTTLITVATSVLALGLAPALIQFGAKAHAKGRTHEVKRLLRASQGFRLLFVAPVLTLLVIAVVDVPTPLLVTAVVFGVWVPAALNGGPVTLFIENKTAAGAQNAMITNLIVQAGVVVTVLWLGTADSVWAARIILSCVGAVLAMLVISRVYRRAVLSPRWPRGWPPGFWRFAIPTGLASLIGQLALQRTEVLYLTWLSTPEAVGLYALAFGLAGHIFAPAQALTGPLMPAVSGLREVEPDSVREALARTLRASATIIAVLTAAAVPALTILVPVLYGTEFTDAAPAFLALGLVTALARATEPVAAFVLSRLSGRTYLRASIAALAVNVAIALATIPWWGLWGAVFANGSAALVQTAVLLGSEKRDLRLTLGATLTPLAPALLGVLASLAGWAVTLPLTAPVVIEAGVAAVVALSLLVLALRVFGTGLAESDSAAIVRVLPHRLRTPANLCLRLLSPHRPKR